MRKTSAKNDVTVFKANLQKVKSFLASVSNPLTAEHLTWAHEYAIIRLYREFEELILDCLVAAINNDTGQLSATTGDQISNTPHR